MKFCVNCKHFDNDDSRPAPVCKRDKVVNVVTGSTDYRTCQQTRADELLCGESAFWYEEKPSA